MAQPQCDGTEKHSHYVIAGGQTFYHTHKHQVTAKEFNRLHHHAPLEHDNCTFEELETDAEYVNTPF